MKAITPFIVLGLIMVSGTIAAYLVYGRPVQGDTLANFGLYAWGLTCTFLNLLALIAFVWTLRQQCALQQRDGERQLAEQHVRWLEALYADIQDLLREPLSGPEDEAWSSLSTALHGEAPTTAMQSTTLKKSLSELMRLLAEYCEAVTLCRDSVSKYFDTQIFVDRGVRILDRVKPFHEMNGMASPITIEFCDVHLRSVNQRNHTEALDRLADRSRSRQRRAADVHSSQGQCSAPKTGTRVVGPARVGGMHRRAWRLAYRSMRRACARAVPVAEMFTMRLLRKLKELLAPPTPAEIQARTMKRILSKPYLTEVPEFWSGLPFVIPNEDFRIELSKGMRAQVGNIWPKRIPRVCKSPDPADSRTS